VEAKEEGEIGAEGAVVLQGCRRKMEKWKTKDYIVMIFGGLPGTKKY
jgi:hypothetical protein